MANKEEVPSQAYSTAAVAEAGMGAHASPTVVPGQRTDVEKAETDESTSPPSSTNGVDKKKPDAADEEPQRSKGKTALIMSALCV